MKKKLKKKNSAIEQLHPKIMDVLTKIQIKNELQIIDLTKDETNILPKNLKVLKIRCPSD